MRAFLTSFYKDLVTELPVLDHGFLLPPTGSGLGTKLSPAVKRRDDSIIRKSAL